ncbi:ABC transporter ATP-binding protein [Mameliella alba]|nr:ABC transporter ATP-binding protein [Antarctobacter heliothermus]MBY6145018.1 ABC transporter ATP-binding protein [Mameliella alba]MCA0955905.1 ABC transporter ATP-binding protein [Mameliella alba]
MQLDLIEFTKRFDGNTVIDKMNLQVESGEMIALLGPSGCGKSTTLFAICGIHRIDEGRLMFGDRDVSHLPSQQRNVGVVFQNYALYPHMTIFDNIAFPLKVQKIDPAEIKTRVHEMAELVHIEALLQRRPAQLSGGQQQRVALARALVRKPDVLLLDEPLANLDAKLRLEMRSEIRRIQQETGLTAILVTHDQVEAMSMCDRIALMNGGRIVQMDTPVEMYRNPRNKFVAGFLGNPPISFVTPGDLPGFGAPQNCAEIGLRPEHVGPQFGNGLRGRVEFIETQGREDLFDVTLPSGRLVRSVQSSGSGISLGQEIDWGYDPSALLCFDGSEARL